MGQIGDMFAGRLFNRRLEQCREKLFRMAYAWTHDRHLAEDVTQQTLVKALERRSQLRDPEKLEQWVFQILANTLRDWYRKDRRLEPLDDHQIVDHYGPEQETRDVEIVWRVRSAVAQLPIAQRQVVTLVDLEGFSYADVAAVLDIPIGTVMSRLSRARQALKSHLDDIACEILGNSIPGAGPQLRVVR